MDLRPLSQKLHLVSFPIFNKRELTSVVCCFLSLLIIITITFFNLFKPQYSLIGGGFLSQVRPKTQKPCDYSTGRWVWDQTLPLRSYSEDCPFLDPGFRCRKNGRQDFDYHKWRWQPQGCDLPRFNASDLLNRSRNGRMVFAGDSISRNQWESLLCMLSKGVANLSTVLEERGNPITKHRGFLSMKFLEFNLTVQYYRAPFLVIADRTPHNASNSKPVRGGGGAIRVDKLHRYSAKWVGADVLVFSAGHWWNHDKTVRMGFYFREGNSVNASMDVMEAFRRSLRTWKLWAIRYLDPARSFIFFRSYSPVHFRNGTWNEGGKCDAKVVPETNYKNLELAESQHNLFISDVLKEMQSVDRKVQLLNISYLTELRSDGHPSVHREAGTPPNAPQDCSHWCLPGVPDTWNEILYAQLLSRGFRTNR